MGEAKRRARRLYQWRQSLSAEDRVVAEVAIRAFDRFVDRFRATGMCYRLSFFLTEYLWEEHGIQAEPVVGYINDGTTRLMASHAWIESSGRRTDISLVHTDNPEVQLSGELIILGEVLKSGTRYTYHREQNQEALEAIEELELDPRFSAIVLQKRLEHTAMVERGRSAEERRRFLDSAPDGLTYAVLANLTRGRV